MDYKELYEKALERAKDFMNDTVHYPLRKGENIMCWIFPELRESDDERIRKRIIQALHGDVLEMDELKEALDWLERQREQHHVDKKEPKKSKRMISAEAKEALYNKPVEWSEEDEQMLNHIICDIESLKEEVVYCKTVCDEEITWLKSLKERMKGE